MANYAEVVVRSNSSHTDNLFTYQIPKFLEGKVEVGHRVLVPFGRGNKPVEGFVFKLVDEFESKYKIKNLVEVLDEAPIFREEDIELVTWMKNRYLCTYMDCINLIYPKGYKLDNYKVVILGEKLRGKSEAMILDEIDSLKEEEKEIVEKLVFGKAEIKVDKLRYINNINNVLNRLEKKQYIELKWRYEDRENEKKVCFVSLIFKDDELEEFIEQNKIRLGKSQKKIVEFLYDNDDVEINDLTGILGVSKQSINSLKEKEILEFEFKQYYREPDFKFKSENKSITLNEEQKNAVKKVTSEMFTEEKKPYLIHGITGSGKTEVYMEIIDHALKEGMSSILLVPEISLTPQTIARLKNRFGPIVGVYHSKLSDGERHDVYKAIKDGKLRILIGARSALFAPFDNLGAIIIDEFHEASYKAENNPKFNAIEVARYMAIKNNTTLVLGSATPSVEEYFRTKTGEYELIEIKERANKKPLPKIEIVDMKKELDTGNTSIFSYELINNIKEAVSKKNQVILFLNRRGYANFVSCKKCGYVFKCDNCDISLTYHKYDNTGVCHYCGYERNIPKTCPECENDNISPSGTGTEKIEEELKSYIPNIKTLRMDKDTTSKKGALEKILSKFKDGEADILIGTQMLSKGLDFENVTLVGILSADMILNFPDFRSFETTYQLITQVSGRAGRSDKEGKVVLQTYDTDHYAIRHAINYDYESFYNDEIKIRKAFGYTPFNNMMRVVVSGENEAQVKKNIDNLHSSLVYLLKERGIDELDFILGPNPCSITKIKNNYRWQILFKDDNIEINLLKGIIKYICITKRDFVFSKEANISIDINPNTIL